MNKKQVEAQLTLIKEQMKTTSESVLKARQEELSERNKEQVSQIIDPLQKSLKDMQEAFNKNKEQQSETFTRLDETIKINMEKTKTPRENDFADILIEKGYERATHTYNEGYDSQQHIQVMDIEFHNQWNNV